MAGDIVNNVVKPGMSYAEVELLLFDQMVPAGTVFPATVEIPLGLCESGKSDSGQYMDIKFGIEGKAVSAGIH